MRLCLLVQRMGTVILHILGGIELRIQRIVHTLVAAADFHMAQTGNLTNQRFQLGCNQL